MSLIHAWKGHVSSSVHHITNAVIKHLLESGINIGTVTESLCDWFGK